MWKIYVYKYRNIDTQTQRDSQISAHHFHQAQAAHEIYMLYGLDVSLDVFGAALRL